MDTPPPTTEPVAPVVPVTPAPTPGTPTPAPAPKRRRGAGFSWLIGALFPIATLVAFGATSGPFWEIYDTSPILFYAGAVVGVLLKAVFVPLLILGALGLGNAIGQVVGGFGFPSPLGMLIVIGFWACVGRGLYALYRSRLRIVLWLLIAVALIAIAVAAYRGSAPLRLMLEGAQGRLAACDEIDPTFRNICLHRAAVATKDRTICERIEGYERVTCIADVVVPATPQDCADIYGREPEVIPGGNAYEVYFCVANVAERTHNPSLCDLTPSPSDPNYSQYDWERIRNDCIQRASAR